MSALWPIGMTYTRYPGCKDPHELGLPGKWVNISVNFAGDFFRAEDTGTGGNALAFGAGRQLDALQGRHHQIYTTSGGRRDPRDRGVMSHAEEVLFRNILLVNYQPQSMQ